MREGLLFLFLWVGVAGASVPKPEIEVFRVDPLVPEADGSTVLSWKVLHAKTVKIVPGLGVVAPVGSKKVVIRTSTTYTLYGRNGAHFAKLELTVTPAQYRPVIRRFQVDRTTVETGESATLSWDVERSEAVRLEPGLGQRLLQGSLVVTPERTTTYTLFAGEVRSSLEVRVVEPPPRLISFSTGRTSVERGAEVRLTWEVRGVSTVRIEGVPGKVLPAKGERGVVAERDTQFVLVAENGSGRVEAAVAVAVLEPSPVIEEFSADPPALVQGQSATVRWKVNNVEEVELGGGLGKRPSSGELVLKSERDLELSLVARNERGEVRRTLALPVRQAPPEFRLFRAEPPAILEGGQLKVSWNVVRAEYVTFFNQEGNQVRERPEGSRWFKLHRSSFFALTAHGPGGETTVKLPLEVLPGTPRLHVVSTLLDSSREGNVGLELGVPTRVRVTVTNNGTGLATGIVLRLRSEGKEVETSAPESTIDELLPGELGKAEFELVLKVNPCKEDGPQRLNAVRLSLFGRYADGAGTPSFEGNLHEVNELVLEPCLSFLAGRPEPGYPLRDLYPGGRPTAERFRPGETIMLRLHNTGIRSAEKVVLRVEQAPGSSPALVGLPVSLEVGTIEDRGTRELPLLKTKNDQLWRDRRLQLVVRIGYSNTEGRRFDSLRNLELEQER